MAQHTYFPSNGPEASSADVLVCCLTSGCELPAHRKQLAALSQHLEAAVVHVELQNDTDASDFVEGLVGDKDTGTSSASPQEELPRLYLQSTSEESVRLLLGHAYGVDIGNRFCVKTASEVALVAKKYEIPELLGKSDAFLAKTMVDRTTDRLRCKPAFWAVHKSGITDSALRFLIFAEQAELGRMLNAVENLVAHIAVLDSMQALQSRAMAEQVQAKTWEKISARVEELQKVIAVSQQATSGTASPRSPFSLSSCSSTSSPGDSPRSTASSTSSTRSTDATSAVGKAPTPRSSASSKLSAKKSWKADRAAEQRRCSRDIVPATSPLTWPAASYYDQPASYEASCQQQYMRAPGNTQYAAAIPTWGPYCMPHNPYQPGCPAWSPYQSPYQHVPREV